MKLFGQWQTRGAVFVRAGVDRRHQPRRRARSSSAPGSAGRTRTSRRSSRPPSSAFLMARRPRPRLHLLGVRRAEPALARALPRVRRLEHVRRGGAGAARPAGRAGRPPPGASPVLRMQDVDATDSPRLLTGLADVDRVLGGGLVPGSVVLLGGEPGIGKSTLLLQVAARLAARAGQVLYVSAEESARQVRLRADRLGAVVDGLHLLAETSVDRILEAAAERPLDGASSSTRSRRSPRPISRRRRARSRRCATRRRVSPSTPRRAGRR